MVRLNNWTPAELRRVRMQLGLTQEDVASIIGMSKVSISRIESGYMTNPWVLQVYGIILERYYAATKGYIPAYRKVGENVFMEGSMRL